MEPFHFSRQKHAIESLILGDSPGDIARAIEEKKQELRDFFHENPVIIAIYGHPWNDRRGVDFTIATNTLNLAREIQRFNESFHKDNTLVVVLIGYNYCEDMLDLWDCPDGKENIELYPIDLNPSSLELDTNDLGMEPDAIFTTQLQPPATRAEYETVVRAIADKVRLNIDTIFSQYPHAPVYTSFHNIDTSILPHATGIFQIVGRCVKQISKARNRTCFVEYYSHDLLEEHGPVRQREYHTIADFLTHVEEGLFWKLDETQAAYLQQIQEQIERAENFPDIDPDSDLARVMDLMSWAKRPGDSLDAVVTINALNSAALGGVLSQVDPLPYDFVSTTPLTEMSYEAIFSYFGQHTEEVLGLAHHDTQPVIRQKIIDRFTQSVQAFFERNGYWYRPEQGILLQFIRSDARKNLGMDILISELLEVTSVNTTTGYLPEERSFDGTVFLIWKNFVKDFGFSVSYGYGWDFERQCGNITSNDSMRVIEPGKPIEWSRVDVLAILAEMATRGQLAGSNFASIQEGFGMNFLENTWYEVPFITFEKSDSLKVYFREVLGVDLALHEYRDWEIQLRDTVLAALQKSSCATHRPLLRDAETYRQAALIYMTNVLETYKHTHPEAQEIIENDPQFSDDFATRIAPAEPCSWGQPLRNPQEGVGFSSLDVATQAAYLLWMKDHVAVLKEQHHATLAKWRQQLDYALIHKQRETLMYHPEMSGILTGLRFLKPYQDLLRQHSDLGCYDVEAMDRAIRTLAQG